MNINESIFDDKAALNSVAQSLAVMARAASRVIMEYYDGKKENQVREKDCGEPVSTADIESDELIRKMLAELYPDIPVVSEEGEKSFPKSGFYFLVDSCDGTAEMLAKTGNFSVNIALMYNNTPIAGVLDLPVMHGNGTYFGFCNPSGDLRAAYKSNGGEKLFQSGAHISELFELLKHPINNDVTVSVPSRFASHLFAGKLQQHFRPGGLRMAHRVPIAKLFCDYLDGKTDVISHVGIADRPWDYAAGLGLVRAFGGEWLMARDAPPLDFRNCAPEKGRMPDFIAFRDGLKGDVQTFIAAENLAEQAKRIEKAA